MSNVDEQLNLLSELASDMADEETKACVLEAENGIRAHIAALEASNKRLREALEFYANGKHMSEHGVDEPPNWVTWDYENGGSIETGAIAKAALAQEAKHE